MWSANHILRAHTVQPTNAAAAAAIFLMQNFHQMNKHRRMHSEWESEREANKKYPPRNDFWSKKQNYSVENEP